MKKSQIATVVFSASCLLGAGIGFVIGGFLHNFYTGLGLGILSFCAAFYFISESKSITELWEDAEE